MVLTLDRKTKPGSTPGLLCYVRNPKIPANLHFLIDDFQMLQSSLEPLLFL